MRKKLIVVVVLLAMITAPNAGFAGPKEWTTSDNYAVRAPSRLLHGVFNAGLSWLQILSEPVYSVQHEDQNFVEGMVDGLANTVYFVYMGAWDVLTFWVPGEKGKEISVKECVVQKTHEQLNAGSSA